MSESRVWFYRPERGWWWWPIYRGHDEFAHRTLVIGLPWTGRLVIAYRSCGDPECEREAEENRHLYAEWEADR